MIVHNCHTHVFTNKVLPRKFLPFGLVRLLAKRKFTRRLARFLHHINPFVDNDIFDHYAIFLETGTIGSEEKFFQKLKSFYPDNSVFAILPMDMEFMGCGKPVQSWKIQHDALSALKENHPDTVRPFVAVDPRREGLLEHVRYYIEEKGFFGIKLYPSLGYFPYDERLTPVWEYAQTKKIPVVAHTSHIGVYSRRWMKEADFSGSRIGKIPFIGKNRSDRCSYFAHPANYRYLMADFPDLKVCLAHCGGEDEWEKYIEKPDCISGAEIDKNWLALCVDLMIEFPGLYTDISETLYKKNLIPVLKTLLSDQTVRNKILFGSDFFMVELEAGEESFSVDLRELIGEIDFLQMAEINAKAFFQK